MWSWPQTSEKLCGRHFLYSAWCILRSPSSKNGTSYKISPYTKSSNCAYAREHRHILGTGDLAAHWSDRLMLLGSPPDMVHGFQSRKTHPSTHKIRCADHTESALTNGIAPAAADCRYKAPLIPRPVWPYFIACHFYRVNLPDSNIL